LSDAQLEQLTNLHLNRWEKIKGYLVPLTPSLQIFQMTKDLKEELYEVLTEVQKEEMEVYNKKVQAAFEATETFKIENREAIKIYTNFYDSIQQNEIQPLIKQQRVKLDHLLSDENKNEIARLSQAKKDNRKEMDEAKMTPEFRKDLVKGSDTPSFRKLKDEKRNINRALLKLAAKLKPEIDEVINEINPQREEWVQKINEQLEIAYQDHPIKKVNESLFRKQWDNRIFRNYYDETNFRSVFLTF